MDEKWVDIPGYETLYQVSNLGRIKSFRESKKFGKQPEYILKSTVSNNGYSQVTLYNGVTRKKFLVHRIVAEAFVPNPKKYPHVNHKNEHTTDNRAENLEWCTAAYNNAYGTARFRAMITKSRLVSQYLISGEYLATYVCARIASEITGISRNLILECCRGDLESTHGFIWKYAGQRQDDL